MLWNTVAYNVEVRKGQTLLQTCTDLSWTVVIEIALFQAESYYVDCQQSN